MHDIWNPWHGCIKCSEGCAHCYMYFLDKSRGANGSKIYLTANADYPLSKDRKGRYKIKSGETLRVCLTSDFFLEEADQWRGRAWNAIRTRRDVVFWLLTKRPQRVERCLPDDWKDGWENVIFNVTCENQKRADERMPFLEKLPFKHKGVMCAPFIGPVSLQPWLKRGFIEQVVCGGENYDGTRPCDFDWVRRLHDECVASNVNFCFIETGTVFIKDGRTYHLKGKRLQSLMAYRSGMNYAGEPITYNLIDDWGWPLSPERRYVPSFRPLCDTCASRPICNGCSNCGKCEHN